MSNPAQRRRFPRVKTQNVAAHVVAGRRSPACVIENLSEGGMFIRTDEVLEVGTAVQVTLVRPGMKKALVLTGRVVAHHAQGGGSRSLPGMGICFDELPVEAHLRLDGMLHDLGLVKPVEFGWTAPQHPPLEVELDAEVLEDAARTAVPPAESARLMLQLQGVLKQLDDARRDLLTRDRQLAELRSELEAVRHGAVLEDQLVAQVHAENEELRTRLAAAEETLERVRVLVAPASSWPVPSAQPLPVLRPVVGTPAKPGR